MTAPWTMPIEAVRGLADLSGHVTLIRLAGKSADLDGSALVVARGQEFTAWVGYRLPGDEVRHEVPVTLSVVARENGR